MVFIPEIVYIISINMVNKLNNKINRKIHYIIQNYSKKDAIKKIACITNPKTGKKFGKQFIEYIYDYHYSQ